MSILRVFDVSNYIYAGSRDEVFTRLIENDGPYRVEELPVGGVNYLLRVVKKYASEDSIKVFCFDKIPTYKRELFEKWFPAYGGYKGGRKQKEMSIIAQQKLAEDILRLVKCNVLGIDTYEADDCIYNVVEHYKGSFDKIYIHTNDSDLYHLVSANVEVLPATRAGKNVTRLNYKDTVDRKYSVEYNLKLYQRLIYGGKDNVPRISDEDCDKITSLMSVKDYATYGDVDILEDLVIRACGEESFAWHVFKIITPRRMAYKDYEIFDEKIDMYSLDQCVQMLSGNSCTHTDIIRLVEDYLNKYGRR